MVRQLPLPPIGAALLGALLLWRLADGSAGFLVQAWYEPILLASGLCLIGLAGWALFSRDGDVRQAPRFTAAGVFAAVFAGGPLLLGFAFRPEALGTSSLDAGALAGRQFSASAASGDPAIRNIYQWAYEFDTRPAAELAGEPVEVIGFVYHREDDTGERFHVARFVVACCVADAQGFALPVQWKQAATLQDNRWVRITGRVATAPDGSPIIQATEIQEIEAPSNPYIYP
jgi:uncharacterized repeat protein (TIGR03943 family)